MKMKVDVISFDNSLILYACLLLVSAYICKVWALSHCRNLFNSQIWTWIDAILCIVDIFYPPLSSQGSNGPALDSRRAPPFHVINHRSGELSSGTLSTKVHHWNMQTKKLMTLLVLGIVDWSRVSCGTQEAKRQVGPAHRMSINHLKEPLLGVGPKFVLDHRAI